MITATAGGIRLTVRVTPRASRSALGGVRDGKLIVKVAAPPVDGAANEALLAFLAKTLDVPRRAVSLIGGETHREKIVAVAGVTESEARRRLGAG